MQNNIIEISNTEEQVTSPPFRPNSPIIPIVQVFPTPILSPNPSPNSTPTSNPSSAPLQVPSSLPISSPTLPPNPSPPDNMAEARRQLMETWRQRRVNAENGIVKKRHPRPRRR